MALGAHYRFTVYNGTGVTIPAGNVVIRGRRWKMSANGIVFEASPVTFFTSGAAINNGTFLSGGNIDNTGNNESWEVGDFELTVTLTSTGNGNVQAFVDPSVDGLTFPDLAAGYPVATIGFDSASTKRLLFRV